MIDAHVEKEEDKRGLLHWLEDWKQMKLYGNEKGASEVFKNMNERFREIRKEGDKTPVMSTNKIKWENEKNIANKKVIEAPIPTNKYPNAYVSIVEEGSDNILAYSRTEKKYLSTGNFLGRFKSIDEAKNKIQEEYEKLKAKDDKTSIMSPEDKKGV